MNNKLKSSPDNQEPKIHVPLIKQMLKDNYKPSEIDRKWKPRAIGRGGENSLQFKLRDTKEDRGVIEVKEVKGLREPKEPSDVHGCKEIKMPRPAKEPSPKFNPPAEMRLSPSRDKQTVVHINKENAMLRKVSILVLAV